MSELKARIQAYLCVTWGDAACVVCAPDEITAKKFAVEAAQEAGYDKTSADDVVVMDPILPLEDWAAQTDGWDIGKCWTVSGAVGAMLDWEKRRRAPTEAAKPEAGLSEEEVRALTKEEADSLLFVDKIHAEDEKRMAGLSEKNDVVEAVRERVRLADSWSKSTGYPPADYFDTIMDLRRMLHAYDSRQVTPSAVSEAMEAVKVLIDALNTDPGYRESWKANIAMAFKDEMKRDGDNIHEAAQRAADNFLNLLTYCAKPKATEGN